MIEPAWRLATHEVINQPGPPPAADPWAAEAALRDYAEAVGADAAPLAALGARIAATDAWEAGREARRHPPEARLFDRGGRRLDDVGFHPAYHELMRLGLEAGYAAISWEGCPRDHVTHAAMVYLLSQVEPGVCCPMTVIYAAVIYAAVPALEADAGLSALWGPRLTALAYDPAVAPVGEKRAATLGMAMTEKQGGSDVRANATLAEAHGDAYRLTGHKWFCSAPMSVAPSRSRRRREG